MCVSNTCIMTDSIKDFYSKPLQYGGDGVPVFKGSRRQIGGSFLSGLARFAMPIIKYIAPRLFSMAKNVAGDVILDKKPLKSSLKDRGVEEVGKVLRGRGGGGGRKRSISLRGIKVPLPPPPKSSASAKKMMKRRRQSSSSSSSRINKSKKKKFHDILS